MLFNISDLNKNSSGIYSIKNENGEIIYIGKAIDFLHRYYTHEVEITNLCKNNIFNFVSELSNTDLWSMEVLELMDGETENNILKREKELILEYGTVCNYENQQNLSILKDLLNYKYKYIELEEKYNNLLSTCKIDEVNKTKLSDINKNKYVFIKTTHLPVNYINLSSWDKLSYLVVVCNSTYNGKIVFKNNSAIKSHADISKILHKSDDNKTARRLIQNGLINRIDNKYYIMNGFSKRGSIKNKSGVYIKLYTDIFYNMYVNYRDTGSRAINPIARLINLIPFINRKYNIVCSNPFETDIEEIKPLTRIEILEKCEYKNGATPQAATSSIKSLCDINYKGNYLFNEIKYLNRKIYVFNPKFLFASNSYEDYKFIVDELLKCRM